MIDDPDTAVNIYQHPVLHLFCTCSARFRCVRNGCRKFTPGFVVLPPRGFDFPQCGCAIFAGVQPSRLILRGGVIIRGRCPRLLTVQPSRLDSLACLILPLRHEAQRSHTCWRCPGTVQPSRLSSSLRLFLSLTFSLFVSLSFSLFLSSPVITCAVKVS